MSPQRSSLDTYLIAIAALGFVLGVLVLARAEERKQRLELDNARRAKAKAENDLEGALETISRLQHGPGEPPG